MRRLLIALTLAGLPVTVSAQTIMGGFWWPLPQWVTAAAPAFATVQLNNTADRFAAVFVSPLTDSVSKVVCSVGTVTSGVAIDVRMEAVAAASGNPDGNLVNANASGQTGVPTSDTIHEVTLTAAAVLTRGTSYAMVWQLSAAGDLLMNTVPMATAGGGGDLPYGNHNTTGSYAKSTNVPACALFYVTQNKWYPVSPLMVPIKTFVAATIDNGTDASHRRGVSVKFPKSGAVCSVGWKGSSAAGADFAIVAYNSDGSQTVQTLVSAQDGNEIINGIGQHEVPTDADWSVTAGVEYYVSINGAAAADLTLYEITVESAAHLDAFGGGQDFHLITYNGSAWTETTTARPWMWFKYCDVTSGGAGIIGG